MGGQNCGYSMTALSETGEPPARLFAVDLRRIRQGLLRCRISIRPMSAQGQMHALPHRSPNKQTRQDGLNAAPRPSRPGEFHPEPLTDPDLPLAGFFATGFFALIA